jgi:hypothetical protein
MLISKLIKQMDFLDNLENSLKNLESQEERDPSTAQRRQDERSRNLQVAPWAEKLKNSDYTRSLFDQAAAAGHRLRAKIYMAWLENVLRLEMKGRWCEVRPTPDGIEAEFILADGSSRKEKIDLTGAPEKLLEQWLGNESAGNHKVV